MSDNRFTLMWQAIKSGDQETAKKLQNKLSLENATEIYNTANNTNIQVPSEPVSSGEIKQHNGPLYKNYYDRWTTETAKGQEFKRFVNGPLKFGVETILAGLTGAGTANRIRKGLTLMKSAEVAPIAEDLLSAAGTTLFGVQGAKGLKQDLRGERKFNPLQTGLDMLMSFPLVSSAKTIATNIDKAYNAGNMWARALRGEKPALHRVKRLLNEKTAVNDLNTKERFYTDYAYDKKEAYNRARRQISDLESYRKSLPVIDATLSTKYRWTIPGSTEFEPTFLDVTFENPLTKTSTTGTQFGSTKMPDRNIIVRTLAKSPYYSSIKYPGNRIGSSITIQEQGNPKSIFSADPNIRQAVIEYRDKINQILGKDGIVGGSTHSIAEGLHSGVPKDLEVYTTPRRLNDVVSKLKVNITDRSTRRLKGSSPFAPNGEIDLHVLDRQGIDWDQIEAIKFPEKVAAERFKEAINPKQSATEYLETDDFIPQGLEFLEEEPWYFEGKPVLNDNDLAEIMLGRMRKEPGFLTSLMRKNNLVGIGGRSQAQQKFAARQTEMGLHLPLQDLDATLDNIEAQIPGFVNFEKAYPNFDYTNIEGNKEFLKYFRLPETYATDFERMKRLYRQAHSQLSPSIRQFSGAKDLKTWQKMARKNAQFNGGDASGAGGNMLLASNTGGMPGAEQVTAAQYLPTYHPEKISTGKDYIDAIEKTKLFNRKIEGKDAHEAMRLGFLDLDWSLAGYTNWSDVLQSIGRSDLKNPEINQKIQGISKIIDVPRMTGVRYGGTNSTYVGNLSGQPISETFSLDKPFEFGRSFVDELAPSRDITYSLGRSGTLADIPVQSRTPELIQEVEDANLIFNQSPEGFNKLRSLGYDVIENKQQFDQKLKELTSIKDFPRNSVDINSQFRPLWKRLHNTWSIKNRLHNISSPVIISGISGGLLGSAIHYIYKENKLANLRHEAFNDLYYNPDFEYLRNNAWGSHRYDYDRVTQKYYVNRYNQMLNDYVDDHREELEERVRKKKEQQKDKKKK